MTSSEVPVSPELQLCSALRELVGWDRIAVVAANGLDHRLPLPGSDAVLRHWGDLQQSLAQGPGADVLATGTPVLVHDLRLGPSPWPVLQAAGPADLPVRSLAVLPLVAADRARVVGTLSVARDAADPFTGVQVGLLTALAALLAAVVAHRLDDGTLLADDDQLTGGGGGPGDEVAVVVGMLTERLGTGTDEALARLRAHAFSSGRTIHEVARAVVAGEVDLASIAEQA